MNGLATNHQPKASAVKWLSSVAALAFMLPSFASTVLINPTDWPGASSKQPVTITNITGLIVGPTNVWAIPSKQYQPTNNYGGYSNIVAAVVTEGSYKALIGPYSVAFNVPNDATVYWLSSLTTNANTVGTLSSLWYSTNNLKAGTNVTFRKSGTTTYVDSAGTANAITNNWKGPAVTLNSDLTANNITANSSITTSNVTATQLTMGTATMMDNGAGQFILDRPVISVIANGDAVGTIYPDAEYLFDVATGQAALNWNTRTLYGSWSLNGTNINPSGGGGISALNLYNTNTPAGVLNGSGTNFGVGTNLTAYALYSSVASSNQTLRTELTNLVNSSSNALANVLNSTFLFGMSHRESWLGFPGADREEEAHIVYSSDFGRTWVGGQGYPTIRTLKPGWGIRDGALFEANNVIAFSYTESTNSLGKTNFPLRVYSSASYWPLATNISLALPGETVVYANWYQWSPNFALFTSNLVDYVYLSGSVSTNSASSFEIRYKITAASNFPHGWSQTYRQTNSLSTLTNIIDSTPFLRGGIWYAWYKNEDTTGPNSKQIQLGRFATYPNSVFTPVLTNDFVSVGGQSWGSYIEGAIPIQLPWGDERVMTVRYNQADYGYNGEGRIWSFADTVGGGSLTNAASWGLLTNCTVPFYIQSMKPLLVTNAQKIAVLKSIADGADYLRGQVNIQPEIGPYYSGLTRKGWAYASPYPSAADTGILTYDHAGIRFGVNGQGGGIFGAGDMKVHLWVPSLTSSDTTLALTNYSKEVASAVSNRFDFTVQPYFNGSPLLTNSSGGTVPDNIITNQWNGVFYLTNTSQNAPSIEMTTSATNATGGQFGPYIKQRMLAYNNGWAFGPIANSNQWIMQWAETPWTRMATINTNGLWELPALRVNGTTTHAGGVTNADWVNTAGGNTNYGPFLAQGTATFNAAVTNNLFSVFNTNGSSAIGRLGHLSGYPTLFADTTALFRYGTTFANFGVSQLGLGSATSPTMYFSYASGTRTLSFWDDSAAPFTVSLNVSNVTGSGRMTMTNGFSIPTNAPSLGFVTNGLAFWWNSNGTVYLRTSRVGATNWADNLQAAAP